MDDLRLYAKIGITFLILSLFICIYGITTVENIKHQKIAKGLLTTSTIGFLITLLVAVWQL